MTPASEPPLQECIITTDDGTIAVKLPFEFGYFPRHKYKDLVFYLKTGENSNCGLIEMHDTEGNRALMEVLASHTSAPAAQERIDAVIKELESLKKQAEDEVPRSPP